MPNLIFQNVFQLTLIYLIFSLTSNCCASFTEDNEEKTIAKVKFYVREKKIKKIYLENIGDSSKTGFLNLEESSLETVQKFPFTTRMIKRYPQLNLSSNDDNMEVISYAEQLIAIYSKVNCPSLGNMMCYLKNTKKKFNGIECLFACTFQEILSYNKLFYLKQKISDESKITGIQKAMCLCHAPVIVALSSLNNVSKKCCRILILYHFNNQDQNFKAHDISQLKDGSIPTVDVSYMSIQLHALEAWIGYNSII